MAKKALGAPDVRDEWSQCVMELGEMISEEVRTNSKYDNLKEHRYCSRGNI